MIFWVHGRIKGQKTVQNDKKLCLLSNKKLSGNIIILHMCTINDNHMIYGSWAMEHDRQIFLSFWITFCPFTPPLKTRKINILKKWKKHLQRSWFYTNVPKIMIICYTVPEIRCMMDVILIFYFGLFFPQPQKLKLFKKWKKTLEISSFYMCTKNIDHMMYDFWNVVRNRQTDRWMEKVTYRGGFPT